MSWWKRAISESAIEAKLQKLYEQHQEGAEWGNFSSQATSMLARYVDGIPQAQELVVKKMQTYMESKMSGWVGGYLEHVASTGDVPAWLLRTINQNLDVNAYGSGSSMTRLLSIINPKQIDEALAKSLLRYGKLPDFAFRGRDIDINIEKDMPRLYAAIVRMVRLNLRTGGLPDLLLGRELAAGGRQAAQLTDALGDMVIAAGCVPVFAYDWMERNLDRTDGKLSPEEFEKWTTGILRAFKRDHGICPPALPWFKRYMMTSKDDGLWSQVMFTVLNPGAAPSTSGRFRNSLGPEIANARRNGVLPERYDDHVVRMVSDYVSRCWSLGCETAQPLDPWIFHYLQAAPIRDRLRHGTEMQRSSRFPLDYLEKKMDELEAHAKELESLMWI